MKIRLYLLTVLFLITASQAQSQINSDMQAMHIINDFYTAYSSLNFKSADRNKLDSLLDKYLTPEEVRKVKKGYEEGYDLITNNKGINRTSLETMIIQTINNQKALNVETGKYEIIKGVKDTYEISYSIGPIIPYDNGVATQTLNSIDILVEKHNDDIKISYITDNIRYHSALKYKKKSQR
jgi:hypothetical protein